MSKPLVVKFKNFRESVLSFLKGKSPTTQIFKEGVGSIILNFGNKFFVLISGVLLVRFLGKEEYGIYSYVLSLIYVLIFPTEFGLSNLVIRETAQGLTKNKLNTVNGVWRWSLRITLLLCTCLIGLSALGLIWGVNKFSQKEIVTFILALSLLPFQALLLLFNSALRGLKHITIGQLSELLILPGLFAILIVLIYFISPGSLTLTNTMGLRSISTLVAFIFSLFFLIKKTPQSIVHAKPDFQGKLWTSSAIPLGLSSGLGMIKTRITIFLMGFFVNFSQIGVFQVALSTYAIAGLVLQATDATIAPQFASLHIQNRKQALQRLVTISSRLVFMSNVLITIGFILFGKKLISVVFTPDYVEAYIPILVLLAGQLINSFVGSVPFLLNMTGHENDVMKVVSLSAIINIITVLIITPIWGIIGGAISTAISLIVAQVMMSILVHKRLGIISHAFYRIKN